MVVVVVVVVAEDVGRELMEVVEAVGPGFPDTRPGVVSIKVVVVTDKGTAAGPTGRGFLKGQGSVTGVGDTATVDFDRVETTDTSSSDWLVAQRELRSFGGMVSTVLNHVLVN